MNGIRSVLKKGFLEFISRENPDVLCLQETRAHPGQVTLAMPGYSAFWNVAEAPGYSGTAVFTRAEPLAVTRGMGMPQHDAEGRVLTLEYRNFFLVNVYTPNSKRDLSRLPYRMAWDADFLSSLKSLEKKKPIIFCGDLNVAHREIDLANPDSNRRTHGFTDEERAGFDAFVKNGFLDTFREFHPDGGHYTWWAPFARCRARNIGWRIDYFCVSKSLRARLIDAAILPDVLGSDHCPVVMLLADS